MKVMNRGIHYSLSKWASIMARKRGMGKQKIEIKKIEKKSALEVTFSKRRTGLFKKAADLCILCGTEAAVIVFSPGRKAFVFGHPSADAVIDRFLGRDTIPRALVPAGHVEVEVGEKEETVGGDGDGGGGFWWDAAVVEDMGLNELEQFRGVLEEMIKKAADRVEDMTMTMMMEMEIESCLSSTSTGMVEYSAAAAALQDYKSSGILHGHGAPQGYGFGYHIR